MAFYESMPKEWRPDTLLIPDEFGRLARLVMFRRVMNTQTQSAVIHAIVYQEGSTYQCTLDFRFRSDRVSEANWTAANLAHTVAGDPFVFPKICWEERPSLSDLLSVAESKGWLSRELGADIKLMDIGIDTKALWSLFNERVPANTMAELRQLSSAGFLLHNPSVYRSYNSHDEFVKRLPQ